MKEKNLNLKSLKQKDIVHFSCGGKATVQSKSVDDGLDVVHLCFEEYPYFSLDFGANGSFKSEWAITTSPFDIIKIEKFVPTILQWYEINDAGEFIQKKGKEYPKDASFKFINGWFTLMDENGRKLDNERYK